MNYMFGKLRMRWYEVALFAIVAGSYTGVMMLFDILKDTSFQDIGISYEWWVIFAVIVVVNCDKSWEAMLKCFEFFLISQPFGTLTLDMGWYYYRSIWLPATFLTLPGGFIAYYCKKQNILGAVILGLGNTIQATLGVYYAAQAIRNFPHHLLSSIVCFGSIYLMSFQIQREKKTRLISIVTPVVFTVIIIVLCEISGLTLI